MEMTSCGSLATQARLVTWQWGLLSISGHTLGKHLYLQHKCYQVPPEGNFLPLPLLYSVLSLHPAFGYCAVPLPVVPSSSPHGHCLCLVMGRSRSNSVVPTFEGWNTLTDDDQACAWRAPSGNTCCSRGWTSS